MDPVGIFETSLNFLRNREVSRNPIEFGTRSSNSIKINGIYSIPMPICFLSDLGGPERLKNINIPIGISRFPARGRHETIKPLKCAYSKNFLGIS